MNYGCRWPIVRPLNPSKIAHYEALMRNADPAGHIIAARDSISVIR